jgi:hypothetical protein
MSVVMLRLRANGGKLHQTLRFGLPFYPGLLSAWTVSACSNRFMGL